jgi:hypothetical protein
VVVGSGKVPTMTVSKSSPDSVLVKAEAAAVDSVIVADGATPTSNVFASVPDTVLVNAVSAGV